MKVDGNGVMRQMTPKDPGPNGWVANQDPITLIGDLAITDATVTVLAKLNLVADGLGNGSGDGAGNPPALQRPRRADEAGWTGLSRPCGRPAAPGQRTAGRSPGLSPDVFSTFRDDVWGSLETILASKDAP